MHLSNLSLDDTRMVMGKLQFFLLCLLMAPISSSLSWEFLPYRNEQHLSDVALTSSPSNYVNDRSKRQVGGTHTPLPSILMFSFKMGTEKISWKLHKNEFADSAPPLYVIREGQIVREKDNDEQRDYAFYQDREGGVAVMVRKKPDGRHFQVTGSYFRDGEEYSIQPIYSEGASDVDHRISKLFHEANLQHDIVDFGSDLLHAVSVDESLIEEMSDIDLKDKGKNTRDERPSFFNLHHEKSTDSADVDNSTETNDVYNSTKSSDENNSTEIIDVRNAIDDSSEMTSQQSSHSERKHTSKDHSQNEGDVPTSTRIKRNIPKDQPKFKENTEIANDNESSESIESDINDNDQDNYVHNSTSSGKDSISMETDDNVHNEVNSSEVKSHEKTRRKRQTKSYVVELQMVIDYGIYEVWYDGVIGLEGEARRAEALRRLRQYYSFVLNGIDLRYSSVSRVADLQMDVTWAGMIIFDTPDPEYWANTEKPPASPRDFVESSAALEAFRAWAQGQGTGLPPSDHVMLFTGHNLTYGGSVSNAGLAYVGSACNPEYYFSVVEEYFEFRDVAIAAHELGHSLGARHDMDGNTCLSFDRYIMTSRFKFPSKRKAQNPWLFSQCSVEYFQDFIKGLDKNDTNCLVTREAVLDNNAIQPFLISLPGEVYVGDDFCRLGDGSESYICRDQHVKDYSTVCYGGIYCYRPGDKKCVPKLPPAGFSCGNKKWCINGTCQFSNMAPATSGDDCPFGDDPGLIGGRTCAERMLTSRSDCYREAFRARCCASCRRYRRNLPGCEYGDMFELCKKEQCVNYEEDYARENCCDTCAELLFTIPSTIETTTTPFVPTTVKGAGNTTKKGDVTSSKGEGTNNHSSGSNRVTPPDESDEQNGGDGGRPIGGGNGNRRKKNYRHTNKSDDSDSDESDDSDEAPPSQYYNRWSYKSADQPREANQPRDGSERMYLIRNLLDGMRDSRDSHRSQRMRLLISVLDRLRRDDMVDILADLTGHSETVQRPSGTERREELIHRGVNSDRQVYIADNRDESTTVQNNESDDSDSSDSSDESR